MEFPAKEGVCVPTFLFTNSITCSVQAYYYIILEESKMETKQSSIVLRF